MQNDKSRSRNLAVVFAVAIASFAFNQGANAQDQQAAGRRWALLIGCGNYQHVSQLPYITNDVHNVSSTLKSWGGYSRECVLEVTDNTPKPSLKKNIENEVTQWLQKVTANDTLFLYFSGHGFRDTDGHLYLAPLDYDPQNKSTTGISLEWLREKVAKCPASVKLIIMDACYAGTDKGEADRPVDSVDLLRPLEGLDKVATLASSAADERSQIWSEKQQSLFSYWLNQGLKGHADKDGDGDINIDELFSYVEFNVTQTAADRLRRPQTPKRIIRGGVQGVPIVARLQPQPLKQVLRDIAEQLADAMNQRGMAKLGVLEFTSDTQVGEVLGGEFGGLGKSCATIVENQLIEKAPGNKFAVVSGRTFRQAVSSQNFQVADLQNSAAITKLANDTGKLSAVVVGSLISRSRDVVNLRCQLFNATDGSLLASTGGKARLNLDEWAEQGRSAVVEPQNEKRADPTDASLPVIPVSTQLIAKLDKRSEGPHPMRDLKCPFKVRIMVAGKERRGSFQGNDLVVSLRKGEDFKIWLENNSGKIVTARVLVDGLDTLPHVQKGIAEMLIAPPVNLEGARHWVLDPQLAKTNVFEVEGFVTEEGKQGKYNRFHIVDVGQLAAARQQFTDQTGLIIVGFYQATAEKRGGVATDLGEEGQRDLTQIHGVGVGNPLCYIAIRYVNAE